MIVESKNNKNIVLVNFINKRIVKNPYVIQ